MYLKYDFISSDTSLIGLDPAGPKLDDAHKDICLDKTDAVFVDAIHSDASTPLLGTLHKQGHADFYPNGGLHQPGCKKSTFGKCVFCECFEKNE